MVKMGNGFSDNPGHRPEDNNDENPDATGYAIFLSHARSSSEESDEDIFDSDVTIYNAGDDDLLVSGVFEY